MQHHLPFVDASYEVFSFINHFYFQIHNNENDLTQTHQVYLNVLLAAVIVYFKRKTQTLFSKIKHIENITWCLDWHYCSYIFFSRKVRRHQYSSSTTWYSSILTSIYIFTCLYLFLPSMKLSWFCLLWSTPAKYNNKKLTRLFGLCFGILPNTLVEVYVFRKIKVNIWSLFIYFLAQFTPTFLFLLEIIVPFQTRKKVMQL